MMAMIVMVMMMMVMVVMVMMWLNAVSSFEAIGRWFLFQALESAAMMRGVAERGVGMWGEVFGGLVVRGGVEGDFRVCLDSWRSIRHQRGFKCIAGIRSGGCYKKSWKSCGEI